MRLDELERQLEEIDGYKEAERRALPGKTVALAIASLRAEHGLTQQQFADRVGMKQSVVARLESGRRAPNTAVLNKIADAFRLVWKPVFETAGYVELAPTAALITSTKLLTERQPPTFQMIEVKALAAMGEITEIHTTLPGLNEDSADLFVMRDPFGGFRAMPSHRRAKPRAVAHELAHSA